MNKLLYANTKNSDMKYASGIDIPDAVFLLELDGKKLVFLDNREIGVFRELNNNPAIDAVALEPIIQEAMKLVDETELENKLGFLILRKQGLAAETLVVPNNFPIGLGDYLRSKNIKLRPVRNIYPERLVKSEAEAEKIRLALVKTTKAYQRIEEVLHQAKIISDKVMYEGVELTSEILKQEVEKVLLENGMASLEGIIISSGVQASMPHHPGSGPIKPHQTIIVDIFPKDLQSGYFADMTRTYVKGKASAKVNRLFEAVLEAQAMAIAAVRAGIELNELHKVCVGTFDKLGFKTQNGEGFIHGTGHGLGLDVHEEPYIRSNYQGQLEAGNVITIEPGLYYKNLGGVRIEDVIYVTENGCINLTEYPKRLVIP